MQNRVPTKPNRALIRPEDGGSAFYATITRADEPTQAGDPLNKATFLKDETAALFGLDPSATPNDVFAWLGEWGQANWKPLAEYNTAGAYTFTVPDDVDELGAFILGGGESGEATFGYRAKGGNSGGLKQVILKKSANDFEAGEEISVVVGAGGVGGKIILGNEITNSNLGGTSAFKSIVSEGGQVADDAFAMRNALKPAPFGLVMFATAVSGSMVAYDPTRDTPLGYGGRNIFDPSDTHIYCGAGGFAYVSHDTVGTVTFQALQTALARPKGTAGSGAYQVTNEAMGESATAPGDGGGGLVVKRKNATASLSGVAGSGADGLVLVYGRKVV